MVHAIGNIDHLNSYLLNGFYKLLVKKVLKFLKHMQGIVRGQAMQRACRFIHVKQSYIITKPVHKNTAMHRLSLPYMGKPS